MKSRRGAKGSRRRERYCACGANPQRGMIKYDWQGGLLHRTAGLQLRLCMRNFAPAKFGEARAAGRRTARARTLFLAVARALIIVQHREDQEVKLGIIIVYRIFNILTCLLSILHCINGNLHMPLHIPCSNYKIIILDCTDDFSMIFKSNFRADYFI